MTIYPVTKEREHRAEGERICVLARSWEKISILIRKEETRQAQTFGTDHKNRLILKYAIEIP
jgi:hypothetical protein